MENYLHFIAGWGAGSLGVLVGHPLDTIKTHQQMSNRKLRTRDALKRIMRNDGIRGFYRGMSCPLVHSGSLNSLFFGVYNASLTSLQSSRGHDENLPSNRGWLLDNFVAGCLAGGAQALITCPSELIKIRIQLGKGLITYIKTEHYTLARVNTFLTVLDLYRKYGIRGLYVGWVPTMWRDVIGGGVYFSSYQLTHHYMYGTLNLTPGFFEILVAGGVAGLTSWIPVIPFDTIKSRIQGDNFANPAYKGMIDCSIDLYKHSSFHGFFKGFFVIIFRSVPVNVAIMSGYELILYIGKNFSVDDLKKYF
ncbi:solute carrier family 25 member 45-like [Copidosoma floridanum]|uniref:solute carrier family 25 member 45-like n=1 Tax=Copidosoma floridanum TaxID=29053 RepID=UPI000C6FBC2E|nr:solute carrier family 25 member 45-like [Copidosoma floridanum]